MIYEYVVGCDERGFDWLTKVCKQTNSSIILKKENLFPNKMLSNICTYNSTRMTCIYFGWWLSKELKKDDDKSNIYAI